MPDTDEKRASDEAKLENLAKWLLSTPPKPHSEMKVGKERKPRTTKGAAKDRS
jgi:hypothetical protein